MHRPLFPVLEPAKRLASNSLVSRFSAANPYNLAHILGAVTSKSMQTGE
jgi:hypothetical protein